MKQQYHLLIIALLFTAFVSAQTQGPITVNNTTYTDEQLVDDILVTGDCAQTSNYSSSLTTSPLGVAYFERDGDAGTYTPPLPNNFPFENGIVLSTGNVMEASGPSNPQRSTAHGVNNNDSDLNTAGGVTNTFDAAFIEFDFVPPTNELKFNYLFVSEEYNQNFECTYSDAFAFVLTEVATGTVTNLAVLPSTDTGNLAVTCTNVRPGVPGSCATPANEQYFERYNFDNTDPTVATNSSIAYDGQTKVLTAFGAVNAGSLYHIKLVIADQGDATLDSAVFIEGGSFDLGLEINVNGESGGIIIEDGEANACEGEIVTLNGEVDSPFTVTYQWYDAIGVIAGEISAQFQTTNAGVYHLIASVTLSNGAICSDTSDDITIIRHAIPTANEPLNLSLCSTNGTGFEPFTLTENDDDVLGTQTDPNFVITYHLNQADADANVSPLPIPYTNISNPQTIIVRIGNIGNQTCHSTESFTISIGNTTTATQPVNPIIRKCDNLADGTENFDLTQFNTEILGTQSNTDYTISYHLLEVDAINGTNAITNTNPYPSSVPEQIIWVRVEDNNNSDCNAITSFTIFLDAIPVANAVVDLRLCDTDNNGSESFDFTAQTVAVLNGQTGMTVSYYNSQVNADAGTATGLITSPYVNTTDPETIFIRVENDVNTTCFATTSFTIDIDPSPIANAVANPEMRLCDVGADGTEVYDLVAAFEAEVVGTQTNTTVTYYDGNNVVIATPNAYAGTLAQEIITIEVDYNDAANVCAVATTTVTIFLDAIPVANAVVDLRLCDTDNNGSESFDFTAQTVAVLNGQTGMTVSYYNSQVNADAGTATGLITSPYVNTTDPETIFIRVENDVNTTCFATTSFTIDIDPSPIANAVANPEMRLCDVGADGTEVYDLVAAFEAEVVGTQTNTTVTYYDGNNVVIATPNAYAGTLAQEIITIEVDYNDAANVCAVATTTVTIFLDAIPVAQQPVEMRQCDVAPFNEETFDLTAQNTVILGGLDPALFTISYYTVDVTNTQIAITDPTAYVVSLPLLSQEIFATVSNNGNSICDGTTSFYVFRDPIYNAAVAQDLLNLEACDDNSPGDLLEVFNLDALIPTILGSIVTTADATVTFYQNQADADVNNTANALTGTNALTSGTQTIHYTISNNDNVDCFSSDLFEIVVYPLPTLPLITNTVAYLYQECDTDLIDGLTVFDNFDDQTALIIGTNNYTVTYHLTQAFAQANTDVVTNGFMNTIPVNQPIGVRIEDPITGCVNTMELMLEVVTAPQGPLAPLPALTYCDTDNDGFGFFDLTTLETAVTSGISGVSVEFFETTGEADLGVGAINTSTLYQNIDTDGSGTGYTQVIYAQLTLDGFTSPLDCYTLVPITLLVIDSPELLSTDLVYKQCEEEPNITDGFVSFDLTSFEQSHLYTVILNNAGGDTSVLNQYSATYYTQVDASGNPVPGSIIPNPNAYENTSTPDQLIYVSVEHVGDATVVPSIPATGCSTIKAITLHVDLLPSTIYTPYVLCDDDSADGKLDFDLTLEPYYSHLIDGATDVSVDFYTTLAAADFGSTSAAEYIDTPTSYENEFNPQSVFARVYNSSTGCYAIEIMHLEVSPNPTPLSTIDIQDQLGNNGVMEECDGNVDGSGTISEQIATFDLTLWETQILNNESGVSAAYYTNIDEAEAGTSSITNPATYNNIANPQTIYVSVINDGSGIANASSTGCYTIVSFELYVPVPEVTITASKDVICVDANGVPLTNTDLPVLTANALPSAPYDYQWMLNGVTIPGATNQSLTVTESGDYTVSASGPTDFDCINVSAVVTIEVSGVPDGFNGNVTTTAFADSHQIVAEATSTIPGIEFWYSLDGAEATTDGTFDNVLPGTHIVTISDGENCWTEDVNVTIIDYPHFFTPNGDGVNDTWAIIGQEGIPISQIYIFDRFGKLLKQLDPDSEGWDGMYNGTQMPASDYWFKIMYIEGDDSTQKEFKAHFSLKR